MDEWGFDIVVTASQKALAAPPGLAMVAVAPRAWERIDANLGAPRFYFDLKKAREFAKLGQTPWTPPVSVAFAPRRRARRVRTQRCRRGARAPRPLRARDSRGGAGARPGTVLARGRALTDRRRDQAAGRDRRRRDPQQPARVARRDHRRRPARAQGQDHSDRHDGRPEPDRRARRARRARDRAARSRRAGPRRSRASKPPSKSSSKRNSRPRSSRRRRRMPPGANAFAKESLPSPTKQFS